MRIKDLITMVLYQGSTTDHNGFLNSRSMFYLGAFFSSISLGFLSDTILKRKRFLTIAIANFIAILLNIILASIPDNKQLYTKSFLNFFDFLTGLFYYST